MKKFVKRWILFFVQRRVNFNLSVFSVYNFFLTIKDESSRQKLVDGIAIIGFYIIQFLNVTKLLTCNFLKFRDANLKSINR